MKCANITCSTAILAILFGTVRSIYLLVNVDNNNEYGAVNKNDMKEGNLKAQYPFY